MSFLKELKVYLPFNPAVPLLSNPSILGARGWCITRSRDWDHPGQHGETLSLLKVQKIIRVWWYAPVITATQEAEAGELLEPRRRRLWWAEMAPLHSSLGNKRETPSQKKEWNSETHNLFQMFWKRKNLRKISSLLYTLKLKRWLLTHHVFLVWKTCTTHSLWCKYSAKNVRLCLCL